MHPRVGDALRFLYPNADPRNDWSVVNDGDGPRIDKWTLPQQQPTAAQIDAAVTALDTSVGAETTRLDSIRSDTDLQDLLAKLTASSAQQIKNYMDANVTSLATAKTVLTKMALLLAMLAKKIN